MVRYGVVLRENPALGGSKGNRAPWVRRDRKAFRGFPERRDPKALRENEVPEANKEQKEIPGHVVLRGSPEHLEQPARKVLKVLGENKDCRD